MGEIVLAAKITHVPTIWMSHTIEKYHGLRQSALDGYASMKKQALDCGVETFLVFDTHWIVNQGFHLNAKARHQGRFTSHELPHMLADMDFAYDGDPELSELIVDHVRAAGQKAMAHTTGGLDLEYGTLLPMHFINEGAYAKVVPVAVNQFASIDENRIAGQAIAAAIKASGRRVAVMASGSLSHAFWPNSKSEAGINAINGEFNHQNDLHVMDLWQQGRWPEFLAMLPEYARICSGECGMGDTALLFGALGWDQYRGKATVHTPYFPSSGTGQTNVTFTP